MKRTLRAYPGIVAPPGTPPGALLDLFEAARLKLVRLQAHQHSPEDVARWRDAGAEDFILHLLHPRLSAEPVAPQPFVDTFAETLERFAAQGIRRVEVHEAPNAAIRGAGAAWAGSADFAAWFEEVARLLEQWWGLEAGFPALAGPSGPSFEPHVAEEAFLEGCRDALAGAHWAALHLNWQTLDEMCGYEGTMRFLRTYLEPFPEQTFVVTSFAYLDPPSDVDVRRAYREFFTLLAQYDRIAGACGVVTPPREPGEIRYRWLFDPDPDCDPPARSGLHPRLPDPRRLWFVWPTPVRAYVQRFGEHQRRYYERYQLTGGHNGVDLAVGSADPEGVPVRAALGGTVEQVTYDRSGYGYHLRVRSYGSGGTEIWLLYAHLSRVNVTSGTLLEGGDVVGWAGASGTAEIPHVHLSMRADDVRLSAVLDWLNPRPYLEMAPRGAPRTPYERTYLLLPEDVDPAWAEAALRATWDRKRFTVGSNLDDAGLGDGLVRRVLAIWPGSRSEDPAHFFERYYPGVTYVPLEAGTPEDLEKLLGESLPRPSRPAQSGTMPVARPRAAYARRYLLLHPGADVTWAQAAVAATWPRGGWTIGGSADDAGLGDLDLRYVLAVNPEGWEADLLSFFDACYPGVTYETLRAESPESLREQLRDYSASFWVSGISPGTPISRGCIEQTSDSLPNLSRDAGTVS